MKQTKIAVCISLLIVASISLYSLYRVELDSARNSSKKAYNVPLALKSGQKPVEGQNGPKNPILVESPSQIKAYVDAQAQKYGLSVQNVDYVVSHESVWNPNIQPNDLAVCKDPLSSNYGKETDSLGLFQINSCYQDKVSDACRLSVVCSTKWALTQIKAGHIKYWSSWVWHLSHPNS